MQFTVWLLCGHINACLQKKESIGKGECLLGITLTQFFMMLGRSLWVLCYGKIVDVTSSRQGAAILETNTM